MHLIARNLRKENSKIGIRLQAAAGAPAGFKGRKQKAKSKKQKAETRKQRSEVGGRRSAEFIPLRRPTALGAGECFHAAKHSDVEAE